jgi:succinoglycan biosynthesis transport protein ExoP
MTWVDFRPSPRNARRRTLVFLCAFVLALVGSLLYVYSRPAEYRSVGRLKIVPAAVVMPPVEAKNAPMVTSDAASFLTEVQILTSRPLLQNVLDRLKQNGAIPDLGGDPVAELQHMLHAEPIAGTQVVQLSAESRQQELVAPLVNTVIDAYRQQLTYAYKGSADGAYREVSDEVSRLEQEVKAKRQAVDAFRTEHDIVSIEHRENDVLAQIERLSQSYTDAKNRQAKAQAQLQALQNSAAAGKAVVRPKDDPVLADMQNRASVLREQWQELQRRYTPTYLALDPNTKSLQARLESLENQIRTQREASSRGNLVEAQEELAAAQRAVEKLRQDVVDNQKQAQEFATHLNEYKALRQDLDHLEDMHRAALDRLAKLQASEQERAPRVEVLEAATPNSIPWRPDYQRDALLAVAGSIVFGLFAAWFVDFIAGPAIAPTMPTVMLQPPWITPTLGREMVVEPRSLAAPDTARLPAPPMLPRHLENSEILGLINAATDEARTAMLAILSGMSTEDLVALRWDQIDFAAGVITLVDEDRRTVQLEEPLRKLLKARLDREPGGAPGTVFRNAKGERVGIEEIQQLIEYSAHDAGLDRPQEVTPDAVRYTWLSFLLRQGIRTVDVSRLAGHVPHQDLIAYMEHHSPKTRKPLAQIERVHPVFGQLARNGIG